jgi:hypothetical protein
VEAGAGQGARHGRFGFNGASGAPAPDGAGSGGRVGVRVGRGREARNAWRDVGEFYRLWRALRPALGERLWPAVGVRGLRSASWA